MAQCPIRHGDIRHWSYSSFAPSSFVIVSQSVNDHAAQSDAPPHDVPPAPPPAPREVTPAVKRRAWRDRHVRVWWMLGLALLGITLYYAGSRTWWWWQEKRLIETGVRVEGEVKGWVPNEDSL